MPETNLGPVVSLASAERIRKQIADAGMCRITTAMAEIEYSCSQGRCTGSYPRGVIPNIEAVRTDPSLSMLYADSEGVQWNHVCGPTGAH